MIKEFILTLGLVLILLAPKLGQGQDERFFRQILSGELKDAGVKDQVAPAPKTYWYTANTPYYDLDLNHDRNPERIVFVKRDNEDWLEIFDSNKKKIFSYRFENMGIYSGLYRIEKRQLTPFTDVLFLYYYVGFTKYFNTDSSARLYLLTIDNDDLKTIHVIKGPSYFEERKTFRQHYHVRNYSIEVRDLNDDLKKEVIFKHAGMSEVLIYYGKGKWKTFLR